ncbi:DNA repair protein recO [Spiroplasma corruscae]|uniref:DNA repair protein RecO n=1 Tax=Spiroplasma corruscae TaxID=216934 RepID=A0A222ENI0_9MOLU|nr:DNA repair protein RecO [Spiroplasma corruscae]ASP28052.1 DNA repair protein recO [Spiroplasma corruscae]
MSTINTKGIVLESIDYEDYAKIVTIFSKKFGKLSFYAPGVNKSISKNRNSVQLFCQSDFELFKSRTIERLSKLKTGVLLASYHKIANNYTVYIFASIIVKVLLQINEISNNNEMIYELSINVIDRLSINKKTFINYCYFLFSILKFTDYKLNLRNCERCGKDKDIVRFDYIDNYIICKSCLKSFEKIQPFSFLELLRLFNEKTIEFIEEFKFNTNDLLILHSIMVDFYEKNLGFNLGPINILKNSDPFQFSKEVADLYK